MKSVPTHIKTTKFYKETVTQIMIKKIFGSTLTPGERVLLKNLSERGGTGKLKSYWENDIYEVVFCHPKLPIYQIKPENGGNKIRTVHRNLLMKCNDLPVETQTSYSTLSTSNQKRKKTKQTATVSVTVHVLILIPNLNTYL